MYCCIALKVVIVKLLNKFYTDVSGDIPYLRIKVLKFYYFDVTKNTYTQS